MAVRHARLLFNLVATLASPRTALSAGTWRTRRACQCAAPCIGSPQSAHRRGGRHVGDVIMIAAKIDSRIECS